MQRLALRQLKTIGSPSLTRQLRNTRWIQTDVYQDKLLKRAKEAGVTLDELKEKAKKAAQEKLAAEKEALEKTLPIHKLKEQAQSSPASGSTGSQAQVAPEPKLKERKDGSPVKDLSTFLNIEKLLSTPHTADQISTLWTAYHASRSGGTGRGFVCASLPSDMHARLEDVARKYPSFIVPIPRPRPADAGPLKEGESDTAYEFYFLQWAFHERPPVPKTDYSNPFDIPTSKNSTNPHLATVLFTPLQEYKLRQAFATPYLIATFYTDLVTTHQRVLMRGEITPAAAAPNGAIAPDRFMLTQEDAQLLVMALQKFYLWSENGAKETEAQKLLHTFHEKPEEFKWEDLVKLGNIVQ